ncbi:MAG: hypothetical protein WEA82_09475 [Idiomarina sp.]
MTRLLILSLTLFISGCASIPISTMLTMSSFDAEDFIRIQPQELEAKIQVDDPVTISIDETRLALELDTQKGLLSYEFPLVLVEQVKIPASPGFFSDDVAKTEYRLELSEQGIEDFKAVKEVFQERQSGQLDFSVLTNIYELPEDSETVRMSIFLQLFEDEGFFTLFYDAEIEIKYKD